MINIKKVLIENNSVFSEISKEFNQKICTKKDIHSSSRISHTLEVYELRERI